MISKRSLSLAIAGAGAAYMAAIALGVLFPAPHPFIGSHLYDLYAQALLQGRFDLPAMELRYEGHFTPDGKGYLYHGLGPLLTRIPFLPFVEMPTAWISGLSIWIWAVIGNASFHRACWLALVKGMGGAENVSGAACAALAAAAWFASPGVLLISGGAVFYEPISMAYALSGGFVLLIVMVAFGRIMLAQSIVPLASLAGLTLHARPHLAVGYYMAVCVIALVLLRRDGLRRWKSAAAAMMVLGLFGAALLASNALRFGNVAAVHGSFTRSDVQYASIFWGIEDQKNSRRARAFAEHGQFSATRILPNLIVYVASPPSDLGMDPAITALERFHNQLIAPSDFVNITQPKVGTLFLWPGWMLLMAIGLTRMSLWRMPAAAGLLGVAIGSLLMLSYPTVTLRYRIDLWPMIALPAVFGLAALSQHVRESQNGRDRWKSALLVLLAVSFFVTLHKTVHSRFINVDPGGEWTTDFCLDLTAKKGFGVARRREICGLDRQGNEPQ